MYSVPPCYECFKLAACLFGNTRDTSVMHEKVKCVCFVYIQMPKVKFKYVQIKMNQVSYTTKTHDKQIVTITILSTVYTAKHTPTSSKCHNHNVIKQF